MKKFLFLISIFSIPVLICWLLIFLIDPCNFFNISRIIDNDTKIKIINRSYEAQTRGNMLWKLLEFERKPCKNLIIGDSQAYHINGELIKELTGNKFYNFSIPGANAETKFSIFWSVVKQTKLNNVIIQFSFPNWKLNQKENLFLSAMDYIDKPYLYLLNVNVIEDSFQNIIFKITGKFSKSINKIQFPITDEQNKLFDSSLKFMYKNYKYPNENINELKKIVNYCKDNKIKIEFVIFPIHQRYYDYLSEHDLMQFNDKFISDLSSQCITHNYSTNRILNNKEENFKDYFHQNQLITDSITRMVWGKNKIQHK